MTTFIEFADEDAAIRYRWGQNLAETMETARVSRKVLVARLSAEYGVEVTVQAVGTWINGQNAPRPHVMVLVAAILRVPPRVLFALDTTIIRAAA